MFKKILEVVEVTLDALLKLSGTERITDMIIEKKQEEFKNDSTICKK